MPGRLVVTAVFALVGAGLAFGLVNLITNADHQKEVRLSRSGVIADGAVTATFPQDHGTIEYTFSASGRKFSGAGSVSGSNPRPEQLRPGDPVRIVYNPAVSCACSPTADLANAKGDNLGLGLFGGVAAGVVAFMWVTRRAIAADRNRALRQHPARDTGHSP